MQNKERFLDANIPDDMAATIRPRSLSDFIGHEGLKQNLSVFVSGARNRAEAMDHVLLYGPPGLGKTTLAHIVANELGTNFRATAAPMLTKQGDLAAILTALEPMDVLFIDDSRRNIIVIPLIVDVIGFFLMTIPYLFWDYDSKKQNMVMEVLKRRAEVTEKRAEEANETVSGGYLG